MLRLFALAAAVVAGAMAVQAAPDFKAAADELRAAFESRPKHELQDAFAGRTTEAARRAERGTRAPRHAKPKLVETRAKPRPIVPRPSGMSEQAFWALIEETREAAGNDTGRQSELLRESLERLDPPAILQFARIRQRLDRGAYTFDLWAAAYVIEDGCSDDCFRDFRGYLISLGRVPYEQALRDPDSLAPVVQDAETGSWENADNVAADAYSSAAGRDFPLDDSDLSGAPRGTPFDENDSSGLVERFPRLAARFR